MIFRNGATIFEYLVSGLGFGDWGCALGSKMYRSWFKVEGLEF